MKCSQKHYLAFLWYWKHLQSLHLGLAYKTMCTINQNKKWSAESWFTTHAANWSHVPACQHILCVVCYISPPVVLLDASVLRVIFKAMAELASVWFNWKQTHHWKICHVRIFLPFGIPYYLFLPYYSSAVHWNVALLSNLQSSGVFFHVNVQRHLQEVFLYRPTAWRENYMFGHSLIDHLLLRIVSFSHAVVMFQGFDCFLFFFKLHIFQHKQVFFFFFFYGQSIAAITQSGFVQHDAFL